MKEFLVANTSIIGFVLAFILAGITCFYKKRAFFSEVFIRYLFLIPLGVGFLFYTSFQMFYPDLWARSIGWDTSPYQVDLGFVDFASAVVALIAVWKDYSFCLAAALMKIFIHTGLAIVRITAIFTVQNFNVGNAGFVLTADILTAISLASCMMFWHHRISLEGHH